ncbi:hypothetical protein D3C76_506900 [compost metagenome]|nr:hypothetical protein PU99_12435 [Pseudomonas putida]NBB62005.1 hypothetical protein [Pseudomonas sp. ODNR1LW]
MTLIVDIVWWGRQGVAKRIFIIMDFLFRVYFQLSELDCFVRPQLQFVEFDVGAADGVLIVCR